MSAISSSPSSLAPPTTPAVGRESHDRRRRWPGATGRRLATIALLAALLIALLAAVPSLRGVLQDIRHIGLGWVALAIALELGSALSFVVFFRLFFDRLPARDARALAWTTEGSGALLPGGGAGGPGCRWSSCPPGRLAHRLDRAPVGRRVLRR